MLGWGNSDTSTYEVGTHHIEVWIDNCMIYRKSFVVDLSPEEKVEKSKRETEQRERARIEEEKRKEKARIEKQKAKEKKVRNICLWIMGVCISLGIIFGIWGLQGLKTLGIIIVVILVLIFRFK
ncbi:hypothetical protein EZS27_017010 [termite gut metagenome]|uniref:Uncharacterized protein n=1 Tax=termite gut metagenome TaxID=433724 RepID=A0A5J4RP91_9ZZZZ